MYYEETMQLVEAFKKNPVIGTLIIVGIVVVIGALVYIDKKRNSTKR